MPDVSRGADHARVVKMGERTITKVHDENGKVLHHEINRGHPRLGLQRQYFHENGDPSFIVTDRGMLSDAEAPAQAVDAPCPDCGREWHDDMIMTVSGDRGPERHCHACNIFWLITP